MARRLVKKRKANREPGPNVRTRRTTRERERERERSLVVDDEVGDFIVVDTGKFEDTRVIGDTERISGIRIAGDRGTVEANRVVEDVYPQRTACVASDATQKARDSSFVLDSARDFAGKQSNWLQNSKSSDFPSPDGDGQQSPITEPSIVTCQSDSATRSSSGLANLHNTEWSSPPSDAPDDNSQAAGWNGETATTSALLANPLPASRLGNVKAAADHPLPATTASRRHYYRPLAPYPPPTTPATNETTTPEERSIPAQVHHVSRQSVQPTKDSFPYHHNSVWMNVITCVAETSRTAIDKMMLRNRAAELIAGRADVELEEEETTGGRNRVFPDACGLVVDKSSAKGLVAITDQGFTVQQVDTGQGLIGEPYAELTIGVGQTSVIHGNSTVLYYKPRKVAASDHAQPASVREISRLASSPPEIAIRLQIDEVGRFSTPYDLSFWSRKLKTIEFFAWFRRETGRGGVKGPPLLTFTLKDAIPHRKSRDIAALDEDDFRWMRKHVVKQFEKAKLFMPGLKEFTVLVTDPKWVSHSQRR